MIVTTDAVPGRETAEALGLVRGASVRARHVGADITAGLRNLFGGALTEYETLLDETRDAAIARLVEAARAAGADAVVALRLQTSMIAQGASEVVAYGTAVRLR
jgi:uncharacterized protein YbjQ (UPF0145 family)